LASKRARSDLILFLNNDAVLNPGAIAEMARWANQPLIGMVGCLLFYPNGLVQHGGVKLLQKGGYEDTMNWIHHDHKKSFESSRLAKMLHIDDAVTAACALMRRDVFEKVGGFDEEAFPIAYSDTRLACKVAKENLFSLYTPFASGIHHESLTRKGNAIEDFDRSIFWHNKVNHV
ncbi:MAG: glycosyltransferase, partial [Parachlamydiaceae bacterium]